MVKSSPKFQGFISNKKRYIWQLFRATDFESLMYPCFTFCRILGIFPYKINASTIKTCKRCYFMSAIITCIVCILGVINLYDIFDDLNLKNVPQKFQRNSFFIFGSFTAIVTFILSEPRMRLLQSIRQLSLRLSPELYQNLSRLIHAKDICGIVYLVVQTSMYFPYIDINIFNKITTIYMRIMMFQMDMLYMNCVCVLKACFKQINDNLMNLEKLIVANDKSYHLRRTYYEQRNPFLFMNLNALQKQHLAISDTARMLKIIFSLQLLFSMAICFTQTTFNLYFYLMQIQPGLPIKEQIFFNYLIESITYGVIKISIIVWACETGKNQAVEINTTVHNVLNITSDKQVKYELRLFSLQLMHCKNVFSTKWFIMNSTLLTAMAGSITTYLLLMLQFLSIFNSCNKKSVTNVMT